MNDAENSAFQPSGLKKVYGIKRDFCHKLKYLTAGIPEVEVTLLLTQQNTILNCCNQPNLFWTEFHIKNLA